MTTRRRGSMPLVALVLLVGSIYLGSVLTNVEAQGGLRNGFYRTTCPSAELLVKTVVRSAVFSNRRTGAGLIRLMFHDCFSEGCDGSLLLDGAGSEKNAVPNQSVHGFEVIDQAKARVEAVCPGVVSCADIVVLAARDSVGALGGPAYDVDLGRRDALGPGNTGDIPSPLLNADQLISNFANKGLSAEQMVALSGAHTVGKAQCGAFQNRLNPTDPTLDPAFAAQLNANCPQGGDQTKLNNLDLVSPTLFDNQYYKNLQKNKGLLTSDQTLFNSASTQSMVNANANNPFVFRNKFKDAILAMGRIGVQTGTAGTIRKSCRG